MVLFLQALPEYTEAMMGGILLGGLGTALGFVAFLILVGIYVYLAFVWMAISRKLGYDKPWLAWIPIANVFLLPILSKKHWVWGLLLFVPIVNIVFGIIWTWTIFERRNYPGWLSLITLLVFVPFIAGLAQLAFLIIQGFVAWKDL
jgi:hypothetical protein